MTNPATMMGNTCANCYHERVLHLKSTDKICKEDCFEKSTNTNPFPNWKAVPKGVSK